MTEHQADESDHAEREREEGQVSEAESLDDAGPIFPGDATAGTPDGESGRPQEGSAGPNAIPDHDEGPERP